MVMMEGTLLDLVPYGRAFDQHAVEWVNGPMAEWWGMDRLMTRAGQERRDREMQENPFRHRFIRFGLRTKDGTPIGSFALMGINAASRQAEIGAGIGNPEYWGGGYGSDGMLLTVTYAFQWLDLRRLYLTTRDDNFRAQRQVEKCGFVREGVRRDWVYHGGQYHDMLVYGLMQADWPGYPVMAERLGLFERARQHAVPARTSNRETKDEVRG